MSLRKQIEELIGRYGIVKVKSVVDKIYNKNIKDESYYEQVKDFIFKVSYNYLKKHNESIPVSRVLYYLQKFKGVDISNPALRVHYERLIKFMRKKAYDRLRYERNQFLKKEKEFLKKIILYNKNGFITRSVCESLTEFFFSYIPVDIEDTGNEKSLTVAIIDILSIGASIYPDKALYINTLAVHLNDDYILDDEFQILMHSLKNYRLTKI